MKKEQRIRAFLWIAVVLWMAVIFAFSAQSADASSDISDPVVDSVLENLFDGGKGLSAIDLIKLKDLVIFIVRKSGHFMEYAVLGVLFASAVSRYQISPKKKFAVSFVSSALYGVTDEIHQLFVPGRACRIFDMVLDSAGALAGVAAVTLILWIVSKKQNKTI